NLVYNSKMSAKVDSALVQDGFDIYHHCFVFSKDGAWTVIQQGMNTERGRARRYHWHSADITDLIVEPHSGIMSDLGREGTLNLTARASGVNRSLAVDLVGAGFDTVMKDIELLRK